MNELFWFLLGLIIGTTAGIIIAKIFVSKALDRILEKMSDSEIVGLKNAVDPAKKEK